MQSILYTMKLFTTSLQQFLKKRINYSQQAAILGRWSRESCDIKTYRRVDLSNEDHCGVCTENTTPITNATISTNNHTYMIINDDVVFM